MEENRNNAQVERRLKEALKNDRARIQIGRISTFGLLEMSRQRLHPSLAEASTEACAHCHGTGRVRSVELTALHVLRMAEEEIARSFSPGVTIFVPTPVALFMLNHKRRAIEEMEQRRGVRVYLQADDELTPPEYRLDRIKQLNPGEEIQPRALPAAPIIEDEPDDLPPEEFEAEAVEAEAPEEAEEQPAAAQGDRERGGRRRRRRRGRGGKFRADEFTESEASDEPQQAPSAPAPRSEAPAPIVALADDAEDDGDEDEDEFEGPQAAGRDGEELGPDGQPRRRRRRGRRGGRRRSRRPEREQSGEAQARPQGGQAADAEQPLPGLGDQPELPEMPEQWTQRVAPLTGDGSEPAAAAEGTNGEQQAAEPQARRRQRRPRRRDDDSATPAAEPIEVARETPSPAEPAAAAQPAPEPLAEPSAEGPSVQIIEVGAEQAAGEDGQRKRGWWRRLIE